METRTLIVKLTIAANIASNRRKMHLKHEPRDEC